MNMNIVLKNILNEAERVLLDNKKDLKLNNVYVGKKIEKARSASSIYLYVNEVKKIDSTFRTETFEAELFIVSDVSSGSEEGYFRSMDLALESRDLLYDYKNLDSNVKIINSGDFYPSSINSINNGFNFNSLAILKITFMLSK